ncbi:MAG TPA: NYN domain-containing protein, partial [Flavisolibacter sp.]
NAVGWKNVLLENALTPIQQYSYTSGKNSSDAALIIDAMDILYSGKVDGFCIVSSDSDFTRLAIRLREAGKKVIGIGEKKTPASLIAACDKFIYLEIIAKASTPEPEGPSKPKPKSKEPRKKPEAPHVEKSILSLIRNSISDVADESGWAFLGDVGSLIIKKRTDFDPRNYGFDKLTPFIRSLPQFEIDERETSNKYIKHIYIRNKN